MISGMTALLRLDIHSQRIVQCRKTANFRSIASRYNHSAWPHDRRTKNHPAQPKRLFARINGEIKGARLLDAARTAQNLCSLLLNQRKAHHPGPHKDLGVVLPVEDGTLRR